MNAFKNLKKKKKPHTQTTGIVMLARQVNIVISPSLDQNPFLKGQLHTGPHGEGPAL